ncbi:MAG: ABC transporter permease [Gammaproteobacteria bacterium]|nr:ABC transporter permease [Gammaproteobacteria bacterium]MXW46815.1 ABC transporter permease [Gammaproteobacteria bacterium]MYD03213.1 ABC transporter permease [Gammaproteobacteria bacterium]MYI24251.1 ABC transporter permease [Gammaproteobacteria bacterium]
MNRFTLIWRNLWRKPIRTVFTMLAVLVVFFLFTLLEGLRIAFSLSDVGPAAQERLLTSHKVSLIMMLPIAYESRIARLPGVEAVSHGTWFGARYQDNPEFAQYPVEAEQYLALNPEIKLDEGQKQAWLGNRMGAIVGRPVANQYGWQLGDRVPLRSSIWTRNNGSDVWEFDIEGIFDDTDAGMNAGVVLFHYDYFDEARAFGKGTIGWYVSKGNGSMPIEDVMASIDAEFENSPAETKTNTEAAFAQEYAQQFGNIGLIVTLILSAVVFMILLVTGHTMAQSVRERIHEMGVLKTLGFTSGSIFRLTVLEGLLLVLPVGILAMLLGWGALTLVAGTMGAMFPAGLQIGAFSITLGLALMLAISLGSVLPPVILALRLDIVALLRTT